MLVVVGVVMVVVVVAVVAALSSAFLSFSFLAFALLVVLDDVDVLVDVADGLTREVRVAVGKEVVNHLTYLWPSMMWVNLQQRCCCGGPHKLVIAVLTFKASSMTGCIIS